MVADTGGGRMDGGIENDELLKDMSGRICCCCCCCCKRRLEEEAGPIIEGFSMRSELCTAAPLGRSMAAAAAAADDDDDTLPCTSLMQVEANPARGIVDDDPITDGNWNTPPLGGGDCCCCCCWPLLII